MTTKAFILANVLHFEIRQAEESGWSFGEVCKFCGWLPKLKWNCCYSLSLPPVALREACPFKTDDFLEKFETAVDPTPSFSENHVADFIQNL